jgi:hypothetical protein
MKVIRRITGLNENTDRVVIAFDAQLCRVTISERDTQSSHEINEPIQLSRRGTFLVLIFNEREIFFEDSVAGFARKATLEINDALSNKSKIIESGNTFLQASRLTNVGTESSTSTDQQDMEPLNPQIEDSSSLASTSNAWTPERPDNLPLASADPSTASLIRKHEHRVRSIFWSRISQLLTYLVMTVEFCVAAVLIWRGAINPVPDERTIYILAGTSIAVFTLLHGSFLLMISSYIAARMSAD